MTCDQMKIEEFKADKAHEEELTRATVQFEHAAMRPVFLLNGGALIAALTFLGHAHPSASWQILAALGAWVFGLSAAGLAAWFGYRSQLCFRKAWSRKIEGDKAAQINFGRKAKRCRSLWGAFIICSLALFAAGGSLAVWFLYLGLSSPPPPAT